MRTIRRQSVQMNGESVAGFGVLDIERSRLRIAARRHLFAARVTAAGVHRRRDNSVPVVDAEDRLMRSERGVVMGWFECVCHFEESGFGTLDLGLDIWKLENCWRVAEIRLRRKTGNWMLETENWHQPDEVRQLTERSWAGATIKF